MESPDEYGGWNCTIMLDRHQVALSSLPKPLGQLPLDRYFPVRAKTREQKSKSFRSAEPAIACITSVLESIDWN
ncbi:MAG: hypothetical protein EAZ69_16085 [Oscillatoriales cyanobacterium]|nr:MAG: hypothetical protein EAZ69_16085 [Oscillatoriales cyanobacterium]